MAPVVAGVVFEGVRALLDRLFPDPEKRAEAELQLRRLEAEGTFAERAAQALAVGQLDTNKAEAASDGWFKGGWRPAVGWTCASALALQFVAGPLLEWGAALTGHPVPPMPRLDGVLWELLFGMLGLGALRTFDKRAGKK